MCNFELNFVSGAARTLSSVPLHDSTMVDSTFLNPAMHP